MKLSDIWNKNKNLIKGNKIVFSSPIEIKRKADSNHPTLKSFIKSIYKDENGNLRADVWEKENLTWLNTSTYGTPEENLTQKFSDSLKRDFGEVEGVTDHDYVTNSYHINPAEPIDWVNKILIESKMMDKSTGGAISYIELPDMTKNLAAVESMIQFMYDHILYCELNVKRDICYRCGFKGTIKIVEDNGKHIWECPACRNRNTAMMFIRRRVCGYIGDANAGAAQARMGDYKARREHTDVPMNEIKQEAAEEISNSLQATA